MDIHRCRFVPFPTSSINALAFNRHHVSSTEKSHKSAPVRLALGRENGSIEVWNPLDGVWHQEVIIHGALGRKIDALVWATEPDSPIADGKVVFGRSRLFSIGGSSSITEWDLAKAKPHRHASGQHGDIWCLGLQPSNPQNQAPSRLVAGTGDGCLALYTIENDDLRLQRILVKSASKKVHFVSLAFQSRHIVAIGCSDGSIRVYDLRNGSMIRKMTLGRDLAAGTKDVIVWCIKALPSGDIVSGDSTGQVCIWDGKTYTQAQRIQSHNQDVLSLAVSADGSTIVSGGMDKRTVLYKRLASHDSRWSKVFHRRYHAHDVKAMASFEGKGMSVVVSGGSDACPVVIPLRDAGQHNHRTLSHLPQSVPLISAPKTRLVVSWWGRELQMWRLPGSAADIAEGSARPDTSQPPKVLKRILLKGKSDITSASVSNDGSLLAVSTSTELKLFRLVTETDGFDRQKLKVTRASAPDSVANQGASLVAISPDGKWVCLVRDGAEIWLLRTEHKLLGGEGSAQSTGSPALRLKRPNRDVPGPLAASGLGSYARTITRIAFASDSRMLAAADLSGFVDTWILADSTRRAPSPESFEETSDDSDDSETPQDVLEGNLWIRNPKGPLIPKLPAAATTLSFSGASPATGTARGSILRDYELLVVTTSCHILVFHPLNGVLAPWSRHNHNAQLPEPLRTSRDLIKGALWQGSRVWLYGVASLFMVDLSQDLARASPEAPPREDERGTKRKRGAQRSGAGDRMEIGGLGPRHVKQATAARQLGMGSDAWTDVDMEDAGDALQGAADSEDDDSEEGTSRGDLDLLRQSRAAGEDDAKSSVSRLGWWHSYKYRPILGAVPLGPSAAVDRSGDETIGQLEAVLVERPLWDAQLPPRVMEGDDREVRDYP